MIEFSYPTGMQLDAVRSDSRLAVNLIPEAHAGYRYSSTKIDPTRPDRAADVFGNRFRACFIAALFDDRRAPLQRKYGNSMIIVFRRPLGARITTW
jgi:hypothetical protein